MTWRELPDLPKPMDRPSVASLSQTLFFTDYTTRSIFTYCMTQNKFGRLPFVTLEERMGKGIIVKKTGTILILSEKTLTKIKKGHVVSQKETQGE
jgi:hypothetical protein